MKTWAGEKLDAARTSVASTKAGLTASAARLKASEAANMQAVAAKKAADLAGVNASFTARLVRSLSCGADTCIPSVSNTL